VNGEIASGAARNGGVSGLDDSIGAS
jgi:hypothetical protein